MGLEVIGGKSARGWREQELFYQLQKLSEGSLVWVLVETSGVLSWWISKDFDLLLTGCESRHRGGQGMAIRALNPAWGEGIGLWTCGFQPLWGTKVSLRWGNRTLDLQVPTSQQHCRSRQPLRLCRELLFRNVVHTGMWIKNSEWVSKLTQQGLPAENLTPRLRTWVPMLSGPLEGEDGFLQVILRPLHFHHTSKVTNTHCTVVIILSFSKVFTRITLCTLRLSSMFFLKYFNVAVTVKTWQYCMVSRYAK